MSFRFQRRVKVAPGVRLNFSKSGVSTSIGRRGASLTVGKRGLYGNVGLPGSGLSYRTRLDTKVQGNRSNLSGAKRKRSSVPQRELIIAMVWDEKKKDFIFSTEDGRLLTPQEEKQARRVHKDELLKAYKKKATEVNRETEKLLNLHHHLFNDNESISELAKSSVPANTVHPPKRETIYEEIYTVRKSQWSLFDKISYLIPNKKKRLEEEIKKEAEVIYEEELSLYYHEQTQLEEEREHRVSLAKRVEAGDLTAMENWIELFLDELDFPLQTEVEFQITTKEIAYVDIDLPEAQDIPEKKATVLKSGRLKIEEKTQREHREHYALLVGGTAFYLASFFFKYLPTITHVYISGFNQVIDTSTGHEKDHYIYSLKIDRDTLFSFQMENVHPIEAFQHFEPRLNATKTYIFKEISPYAPD